MKAFLTFLVLFPLAASAGSDHGGSSIPDTSGAQRALENAQAGTQAEIERIIRREVEKRRGPQEERSGRSVPPPPPRRPDDNCGRSFWEKSDALRSCPEATAMKARNNDGEAYYYCDCE